MKKLKSILLLTAGIFLLNGCGKPETSVQSETADLFAMDTYMHLQVYSVNGQKPIAQASERIQQLENLFSVTIPESDISHINTNQPVAVSKETIEVLQEALQVNQESQGALTVTIYPVLHEWGFTTEKMHVPDEKTIQTLLPLADDSVIQINDNTVFLPEKRKLDLGALAKGYTSDEVMKIFKENGAESGIISLGGNVQALGRKPDGSLWSVGVVNPFSPSENMCVLKIEDAAVITSGNYERYFIDDDGQMYWHILDPADG
ncbi:MAG: FAD:protein FMN transferase, partial [Oscillospiraceae bacterium]|nr:FAD:protein FMN transferase [Oscillospiraceae bacterium]